MPWLDMLNTIQYYLNQAKTSLTSVCDYPLLEAEILLAYALRQARAYLYTHPNYRLSDEESNRFMDYLQRRQSGEPMAYITGKREFWSLDLLVTQDTLIPRPETELVVETVLDISKCFDHHPLKVADLGTGCGAIALALAYERPSWQISATDISQYALMVARQNTTLLSIKNLDFFQGNWCTALPHSDFDVIVSNPPYLAETEWVEYAHGLLFEPRHALVSGQDGLDAIKEICLSSKYFLKSAGFLAIEHGYSQGLAVRQLFAQAGYNHPETLRDGSGLERVTLAQCK